MTPEAFGIILLAVGILGAHMETLRLLRDCKRQLAVDASNFTDTLTDMSEGVTEGIAELVRIGSDVADQVDTIGMAAPMASISAESAPLDVPSAIMSLIANQILGGNDGDKRQERTIQTQDDTTTPSGSNE